MNIPIDYSMSLEAIVRGTFHCERNGYGGVVDSSAFRIAPITAAVFCIAKLYMPIHKDIVDDFYSKWLIVMTASETPSNEVVEQYVDDLRNLVKVMSVGNTL